MEIGYWALDIVHQASGIRNHASCIKLEAVGIQIQHRFGLRLMASQPKLVGLYASGCGKAWGHRQNKVVDG